MSDDRIAAVVEKICQNLIARADELNEMDAVLGDGEHGSNIRKCFSLVQGKVVGWAGLDAAGYLKQIGMTLLSAGGGTATTLMGFGAMKLSGIIEGQPLSDPAVIGEALGGMLKSVQERSQAEIGDKTLMDALIPAIGAFRKVESAGFAEAFKSAAQAALKGALETKKMIAKRGRGFYVGERGLGTADPGATSVAVIFQSIAESLG
jgi:dihydroxyacetone kinase-like protein